MIGSFKDGKIRYLEVTKPRGEYHDVVLLTNRRRLSNLWMNRINHPSKRNTCQHVRWSNEKGSCRILSEESWCGASFLDEKRPTRVCFSRSLAIANRPYTCKIEHHFVVVVYLHWKTASKLWYIRTKNTVLWTTCMLTDVKATNSYYYDSCAHDLRNSRSFVVLQRIM